MEFNNFRWRVSARIVAYIDWFVSRFAMVVICAVVVIGIIATVLILADLWIPRNTNKNDVLWIAWIILSSMGFPICVITLYYWSATLLLQATKLGAHPAAVVDKAKVWLSLNIIYFLLGNLIMLPFQNYGATALTASVRGYLIFGVRKYIKELEESCSPSQKAE